MVSKSLPAVNVSLLAPRAPLVTALTNSWRDWGTSMAAAGAATRIRASAIPVVFTGANMGPARGRCKGGRGPAAGQVVSGRGPAAGGARPGGAAVAVVPRHDAPRLQTGRIEVADVRGSARHDGEIQHLCEISEEHTS